MLILKLVRKQGDMIKINKGEYWLIKNNRCLEKI